MGGHSQGMAVRAAVVRDGHLAPQGHAPSDLHSDAPDADVQALFNNMCTLCTVCFAITALVLCIDNGGPGDAQ